MTESLGVGVVGLHEGRTMLIALDRATCCHAVAGCDLREEKIAAAREWVRDDDDHPGRFETIEGLPGDVVALKVSGIVTSQDYRDMLVPLVEAKLKAHDKLKFLVVIDDDFVSYSPEAAWDDARFGLGHWADFGRIAVVTDIGWIRTATRLFAPLMPGELHIFALDELEDAKRWIKR